jgi:integrase
VSLLGKKEIQEALGTADPKEAARKARVAAAQTDALFARLRAGASSDPEERKAWADRAGWDDMLPHEWEDENESTALSEEMEEREAQLKEYFEETLERVFRRMREERRDDARARAAGMPAPSDAEARGFPEVLQEWQKRRKPTPATVESMNRTLSRFWDVNGRLSVRGVAKSHVLAFQKHYLDAGSSPATVRQQIGLLKALLSVAVNMELIRSNPAAGVTTELEKHAKVARLPFTTKDVQRIVDKLPSSGARYWIPLISLYSGMRLEEIGQLAPPDVGTETYIDAHGAEHAVPVIYVTDEGEGQGLKNAASRRRVPLHPELVRLGFVEYATAQQGARIFSELGKTKTGRETHGFSRWFGGFLRTQCEITDKRKAFHSFRHLFKDVMREHGVPEDVSDALSGHTNGSVARNYGGNYYPLRPLVEAMGRYKVHGLKLPA